MRTFAVGTRRRYVIANSAEAVILPAVLCYHLLSTRLEGPCVEWETLRSSACTPPPVLEAYAGAIIEAIRPTAVAVAGAVRGAGSSGVHADDRRPVPRAQVCFSSSTSYEPSSSSSAAGAGTESRSAADIPSGPRSPSLLLLPSLHFGSSGGVHIAGQEQQRQRVADVLRLKRFTVTLPPTDLVLDLDDGTLRDTSDDD